MFVLKILVSSEILRWCDALVGAYGFGPVSCNTMILVLRLPRYVKPKNCIEKMQYLMMSSIKHCFLKMLMAEYLIISNKYTTMTLVDPVIIMESSVRMRVTQFELEHDHKKLRKRYCTMDQKSERSNV